MIVNNDLVGNGGAADVRNHYGLVAADVYHTDILPMFSVPWVQFDGAELIVSGAHLPLAGDVSRLSVKFEPDVSWQFDYPLASPEFGDHYWFWPNSHLSGFRVRINLPASAPRSNPFSFTFCDKQGPSAQDDKVAHAWRDRSRVWVPRDLGAFVGFPIDASLITRVQTWSDQKTVTLTGYNAFRAFESLLTHYGVRPTNNTHILDWGCGHGRVTRHFLQHWTQAHIAGADIDAETIDWCSQNLFGGTFVTAPLYPPLPFSSGSFDAIIGLSVMTHLVEDAQLAWLEELHRLLKPGGIALISFGGHGAAAYASIHHSPEWWHRWTTAGFDDAQMDPALHGKTADDTYYRITHQAPAHVRRCWSKILPITDIVAQAVGYQDVAVLHRPTS